MAFAYSYVRVCAGRLGCGKTTYIVREMLAIRKADPKRWLATNVDLTAAGVERLQPLIQLSYGQIRRWWEHTPMHCDVYVDEATYHFDARAAMKRDADGMTEAHGHLRKQDTSITYICHSLDHLDKRIRDYAQIFSWITSVRHIGEVMGLPLPEWHIVRHYADQDLRNPLSWNLSRGGREVWELFDSWAYGTAQAVKRLAVDDGDTSATAPSDRGPGAWRAVLWGLMCAFVLGYLSLHL